MICFFKVKILLLLVMNGVYKSVDISLHNGSKEICVNH